MRARVILPVVALLGLGLAACGDDGPNQTGSTNATNPPPVSSSAPANPSSPASSTPAPVTPAPASPAPAAPAQ